METYLSSAAAFLAGNARLIDRRRFDLATGQGGGAGVLAALAAYRNPEGGFGWALEPDLRSPESQPAGALHAFEVLAEVGGASEFGGPLYFAAGSPAAALDWRSYITVHTVKILRASPPR